jgi:serine/threonine protein kinase
MIQHMNCRRVKEREIQFDSHMSGFVYKVRVHGRQLIKKEIPGPDTVEEFLYEINALNSLQAANNVIQFYGVVVDEREELVTGLLISYAERGALIDVIYDHDHSLPWPTREKWARQIVTGLSEIHEAGFVQGDFTLSNIVIDKNEDAKIIDINRRGCPIGWEPPEATPMIESGQRISMYIGVKSDLYQLGMVLWALAMQEDEPEAFGRPLKIDSGVQVPAWYKRVVDTCLSVNPRNRLHACQLLSWFPDREEESHYGAPNGSFTSLNDDISSRHDYIPDHFPNGVPRIMTVHPPNDWAYVGWNAHSVPDDSYYYPARGRSPPSPMPSNQGDYKSLRYGPRMHTWSDRYNHALTVPSVGNKPSSNFGGHSSAQMRRSMESLGKYPGRVSIDDESLVADQPRSLPSNKPQKSRGRIQAQTSLNADKQIRSSLGSVESSVDTPVRDPGPADNSTTRKPATGPESQTDSGKDVTDLASTPREKQLAGVIPRDDREETRGQSHGGKRSIGTAEGGVTTSMGLSMPTLEPDVGVSSDNEKNDCFSGRLAQPDDLAGVGSAYGLPFPDSLTGNEKRRIDGEMILDDELGLDLDAGLSRLAVGALDNPGR